MSEIHPINELSESLVEADEAVTEVNSGGEGVISPFATEEQASEPLPLDTIDVVEQESTRWRKTKEWLKSHKLAVAMGTVAVASTVATVFTGDLKQIAEDVGETAPWMAAGVVASEGAFIAGGAGMLAAAGVRGYNVIRIRNSVSELNDSITAGQAPDQYLKDNKLFRAGFAVNAAGAVGTVGVLAAGVIETMPPQSWGVISAGALDVLATVSTRAAIWGSLRSANSEELPSEPTEEA